MKKNRTLLAIVLVAFNLMIPVFAAAQAQEQEVEAPALTLVPGEKGIYVYVESLPAKDVSGFVLYRAELPSLEEITAQMEEAGAKYAEEMGTDIENSIAEIEKKVFGDESLEEAVARAAELEGKSDAASQELLKEYETKMDEYERLHNEAESGMDEAAEAQSMQQKLLADYNRLNGGDDSNYVKITNEPVAPIVSMDRARKTVSGDIDKILEALGAQNPEEFVRDYFKSPERYNDEIKYSTNVNNLLGRLFIDEKVENDARYAYKAVLLDETGKETKTLGPVVTTYTPAAISVPANLAPEVNTDGIKLTWSYPENSRGMIGTDVFRAESGSTQFIKVSPLLEAVTLSSYIDTTAVGGTAYVYRVAAVNRAGENGEYSNEVEASKQAGIGNTVAAMPALELDGIGAKVLWTPDKYPAGSSVNIYRSNRITDTFSKINNGPVPVEKGVYMDSSLFQGTIYYYRLAVVEKGGAEGAKSPAASISIPDNNPPTRPQGLEIVEGDASQKVLRWNAVNDISLLGYYLYSGQEKGGMKKVSNEAIRGVETGLPEMKTDAAGSVYYAVTAVDKSLNESPLSEVVEIKIKDTKAPQQPAALTAVSGNGNAELSWQPSFEKDITGYRIFRKEKDAAGFEMLEELDAKEGSSYKDEDAAPGIKIEYAISAVDTSGNESEMSEKVEITPYDTIPPCTPDELTVIKNEAGAEIKWIACEDNDLLGYTLLRAETETGVYTAIADKSTLDKKANTYKDLSIKSGATYWYRIQAEDTSGNKSPRSTTKKLESPSPE